MPDIFSSFWKFLIHIWLSFTGLTKLFLNLMCMCILWISFWKLLFLLPLALVLNGLYDPKKIWRILKYYPCNLQQIPLVYIFSIYYLIFSEKLLEKSSAREQVHWKCPFWVTNPVLLWSSIRSGIDTHTEFMSSVVEYLQFNYLYLYYLLRFRKSIPSLDLLFLPS